MTFAALACGLLGAALMAPALLEIMDAASPTHVLFGPTLGNAFLVGLIAANVALVVGSVGLWWMRAWGRSVCLAGLALRAVHDLAFALHPSDAVAHGPFFFSVAVYVAIGFVLVRQAEAFTAPPRP